MTTMILTSDGSEPPIPSFADLVARYAGEEFDPPETETVSLSASLANGHDPRRLVAYLGDLGIAVAALDDLLKINDVADEEELFAFPVLEGIALSIASDGAWVLFQP
jgi:hypothetical protein